MNVHKNEVEELCRCDKIGAAIVRPEVGGVARDDNAEAAAIFSIKKCASDMSRAHSYIPPVTNGNLDIKLLSISIIRRIRLAAPEG